MAGYPYQNRYNYYDSGNMQQFNTGIKGRMVASFEEARVNPIDFDGSIFYFPDTTGTRIYTKQIGLDGKPSLKVYELVENVEMQTNNSNNINMNDFVSKKEFKEIIEQLNQQLQELKQIPEQPTKNFNF